MNGNDERLALIAVAALVAGMIGWALWSVTTPRYERGGRYVMRGTTISGAALDTTCGQLAPDHLNWFGWPHAAYVPHKMLYPLAPGTEISRLIYGAPGAYNQVTPSSQRSWLFTPPSEVDY